MVLFFRFSELLDENGKYLFMCTMAANWLAARIDLMAVVITSVTAFLIVASGDQMPPALAGLAFTYSTQIVGVFQFAIRMASELELRFLSVERINHYIRVRQVLHSMQRCSVSHSMFKFCYLHRL